MRIWRSIKHEFPHSTYYANSDGSYHREDGPAQEYSDGSKSWWYQGELVDVSSQKEFEQWLKYKAFR